MLSDDKKERENQEEFLVALKYFHELCVNHGIQYSLHGGSLLGAIREHGFIPWDDDIDTSMTRDNYEKFRALVKTMQLEPGYSFDENTTRMPHLCLRREGKPFVWITIFVYDLISEKPLFCKIKLFCNKYYAMVLTTNKENLLKKTKTKGLKYKAKKLLEEFLWERVNRKDREATLKRLDHFNRYRLTGNGTRVFRSNDTTEDNGIYITLPADVMDEYMIVPFEDQEAMINKKYDMVLSSSYGKDYMTPKKDTSKALQHEILRQNLLDSN